MASRVYDELYEAGFQNAFLVEGGITTWSEEIDPSAPKY